MTTPAGLVKTAADTIPRREAEILLMHLLRVSRHELYLSTTRVSPATAQTFSCLAAEVKQGRPVQYVTNSAPFLDLSLYVDERVLIPRPETEQLVARAAEKMTDPELIIDYGTGSGCIAITLAREFNKARVVAVDTSSEALAVARLNCRELGVADRVELRQASDLDDPVFTPLRGKVDLLISNPPYVPDSRIPFLDPRVRDHEPKTSLDGGRNGTRILTMLLDKGRELLAPGGLLALEIDETQADLLRERAESAVIEKDLAGKPRYLFVNRSART